MTIQLLLLLLLLTNFVARHDIQSCVHSVVANNNYNNNLRLIMVKTNRSSLHAVYNIQQSATQGSNDSIDREFEFYEFFSFVKYNEFYEFFFG